MNILIGNDDGVNSVGLRMLAEHLAKEHRVLVVAPSEQRSAFSHKLTMHERVVFSDLGGENPRYCALSGSPADCVKFALWHFRDFPVDLIVSGINYGGNVGTDIMYSGTCAVSREGASLGIASVAFSLDTGEEYDFTYAAEFARRHIKALAAMCCEDTFINVNFPNIPSGEIKGVKLCEVGKLRYNELYHREGEDFILKGKQDETYEFKAGTDCAWINEGYVTVSPVYTVKANEQRLQALAEEGYFQ